MNRRTAVWGAATLAGTALIMSAPAVMAAAGSLGGHRVVDTPGFAEPGAGHRVVTKPQDSAATTAAATTAVKVAAASSGSTSFAYTSQAGDYIGQGQSRTFTASATTSVAVTGNREHIAVSVDDATSGSWWYAQLSAGAGDTLHPGTYTGAERDSFRTGRSPGLDAYGDGRGCNEVFGRFTVNQIAFDDAGQLTMADITFVQNCESASAPAFIGTVHLNQFPLSYRQASDAGDYIGGGVTKSYLGSTSLVDVDGDADAFQFSVSGLRDDWTGLVAAPAGTTFTVGTTYQTTRSGDATHARLDVFGNGRGCNESTGSLTVQSLTISGGQITHLRAVFEQHCEGGTPALRGTLRYFA
jgi:hypothetical protein